MSKVRVYELAKELGVENRVVLGIIQELGLVGRSSHSSALDSDEVERIKRVLKSQAAQAKADSEVVTRRVDKSSGTTESFVERRKGNVIRRRKTSEEPEQAPVVVAAEPQSVEAPVVPTAGVEAAAPAPQEIADDMSPAASIEERAVSQEQVTQGGDSSVDGSAARAEPLLAVESAVSAPEVAEAPVAAAVPAATPAAVERKGPGPRVLGKIDLPVRKPIKSEKSSSAGPWVPGAAVVVAVKEGGEDEEDSWKKREERRKKSRRREISSTDLVDYDGRPRRTGKTKRSQEQSKDQAPEVAAPKGGRRVVKMDQAITVGELARQMSLKVGEVIAKLMELGMMATINQSIDQDTATIVSEEFGFEVESTSFDEQTALGANTKYVETDVEPRSPVVTVMGHVDHGKTSLLDVIRSSSVAAREAGGITQHIGAYRVTLEDGRSVTFLDTPGHAAFTQMRARGAKVTDVVILVVAADDGVMPQTIEALNHAKAAGVPMVVAVNKIDKADAQPDRVKAQLAEHGVQPEDWGGDTMFCPVSATKKLGIKELLEGVLLQAEMKQLGSNPKRPALGAIIEARQERGLGDVATVLVQHGTLRVGDIFVSGRQWGRVRTMLDDRGAKIKEAGPSIPVEITGFSGLPDAGDDFVVVESETVAREIFQNRQEGAAARERALASGPISLEEFALRANSMAAAELKIILKADVQGSVEAVKKSVEDLSTEKVKVIVLHAAVGGVTESDIQLAIASGAIVVGFSVRAESRVLAEAENAGIQIRFYRIIYELLDDVRKAMTGLLAPVKKEERLGKVEVRETFNAPKIGTIAGCFVVEGFVRRGAGVRLLRDSRVVHEGKLGSLRRFKDDVKEVQTGFECGLSLEGYNDVKVGDALEVFEIKEVAATL